MQLMSPMNSHPLRWDRDLTMHGLAATAGIKLDKEVQRALEKEVGLLQVGIVLPKRLTALYCHALWGVAAAS